MKTAARPWLGHIPAMQLHILAITAHNAIFIPSSRSHDDRYGIHSNPLILLVRPPARLSSRAITHLSARALARPFV